MKANGKFLVLVLVQMVSAAAMAVAADEGDIVVVNPPGKKVVEEPKPANTNTTGKLKTPKLLLSTARNMPKVQCNYGYEIKTTDARVKKPIVAFYFVAQSADGTREFSKGYDRKGSLAEKAEIFQYDIMKSYSVKEPTVFAKDVRAVATHFEDTPWMDKRGALQVVLYRFELWVDGEMLDSFDSKAPATWKQMKIPDDWYKHDSTATVF